MATSRPQFASTSLYVGDLAPDVSETVLYDFFISVGPVASIRVCRDSNTRKSLRYAYVNYHSIADAEKALETLNYTPIKGHPCRIMWSQRDPTVRKSTAGNLYVRNLDKGVDNRALHDTFSLFGNILSCKVVTDEQGRSKGYGFVHFESDEAAMSAVERVNGMKIGAKEVFVGPFQKRAERPNGRAQNFTNVYARGYPPSWSEQKVRQIFGAFGEINSAYVTADSHGRPFACLNYSDPDQARNAVISLNGRQATVKGLLPPKNNDRTTNDQNGSHHHPDDDDDDDQQQQQQSMEKQTDSQPLESSADKPQGDKAPEKAADQAADQAVADKPQGDKAAESGKPSEATEASRRAEEHEEIYTLYVDRAQDRSERNASFRAKVDRSSANTRAKYDGVNLYIKNLSDSVDDSALRLLFEPFGTITSAKVMRDEDGHSKGFGFVCFTTPEEATKALADMHLKLHDSKPLYVGLAEQKDRRQARLQSHFKATRPPPSVSHNTMPPAAATPSYPLGYFSSVMNPQQVHPAGPWGAGPQPTFPPTRPNYMWKNPTSLGGPNHLSGPGPAAGPLSASMNGSMGVGSGLASGPGPMAGGPMAGGPMAGGPMPGGPMAGGPMGGGPMTQGPMTQGPMTQGQMGQGQMTGGPMSAGPMPGGPMAAGPMAGGAPMTAFPLRGGVNVVPMQRRPASEISTKQIIGEQLFPKVQKYQPDLAGKITGMMLDMDETELKLLLESEHELKLKIDEAIRVLEKAQQVVNH